MNFSSSTALLLLALTFTVRADDWPMWRHDSGREATTTETLPSTLHLRWTHSFPAPKPAYRHRRLQFDRGYEPIVHNHTLYFGSSVNDSITALDAETGTRKWRFYTDGPVRFAPVAWKDRIFAGSDDGHLYCLNAQTGALIWKYRAAPSKRKLLGNKRLISVWPVRGGPVVHDGTVYFAAGVWSFEGVFVYALDADSGKVVWLNDRSGYVFGLHPHGAQAFGGLSPQGYLVINGDDLIVPCGAAVPATFDRHTGALKHFELPGPGRVPGAWFASVLKKMSTNGPSQSIVFDSSLSQDEHEDRIREGTGLPNIGSTIQTATQSLSLTNRLPSLDEDLTSLVVADGNLFASTTDGTIACFTGIPGPTTKLVEHPSPPHPADGWTAKAKSLLQSAGDPKGYAIVLGLEDGRVLEELARQSDLSLIGVDADPEKIHTLREQFDRAGLYGSRIALQAADASDWNPPPYLAGLIATENPALLSLTSVDRIFNSLRPYGGTACLPLATTDRVMEWMKTQKEPQARLRTEENWLVLRREGALPGALNYTGDWTSPDPLVKAPLGVLWFDDTLGHFKRSPQPMIVDGIMVSQPKNWAKGLPRPYSLLPTVYSDVYTGRVLTPEEVGKVEHYLPSWDAAKAQPNQYRPPGFSGDPYNPPKPELGHRVNPLTGIEEKREIFRSYGCDGGVDYGFLYTMRSGTAAFYDKRAESGTINISGPRSGCSNSIIPANGVLNVPYFFEGCTCSYPLPVGLVMINMPPEHEQWTAWGDGPTNQIQRLGVNLGAPGDRMTDSGTLWLDYPSVGGPSPQIQIQTQPAAPRSFYRHATWLSGQGWPWVTGSGLENLHSISIAGLKPGRYTLRLSFAEPNASAAGARVFAVAIQGRQVIDHLDVLAEAGGTLRGVVKEFRDVELDDSLTITLSPQQGAPILSGVELVAAHLEAGSIPQFERLPAQLLTRN